MSDVDVEQLLDQHEADELLDELIDQVGAEQLLSAVLARVEGKNVLVETRKEPRILTEEEREEFRRYLRGQGLSERTTEGTVWAVRQLERPEEGNFTGPDPPKVPCRYVREEDWIERRAFELDWWDGSGTNNRRKALRHVCQWQGQPIWRSLEGTIPPANPQKRPVPTWETIVELTARQSRSAYYPEMCRHVAHFLAHTGRRISEARDLKISDVDWETCEITLWSEKQDEYRPMRYEPFIVSAPNGPSLKHYVEYVRPRPQDGWEDHLFLKKNGKGWTYDRLQRRLCKWGKEIWPEFYSHGLRKFAATTLLIENDYDLKRTAIRLGIKSKTVEDHYLDLAVIRKEMGTSFRMPRVRRGGGS